MPVDITTYTYNIHTHGMHICIYIYHMYIYVCIYIPYCLKETQIAGQRNKPPAQSSCILKFYDKYICINHIRIRRCVHTKTHDSNTQYSKFVCLVVSTVSTHPKHTKYMSIFGPHKCGGGNTIRMPNHQPVISRSYWYKTPFPIKTKV